MGLLEKYISALRNERRLLGAKDGSTKRIILNYNNAPVHNAAVNCNAQLLKRKIAYTIQCFKQEYAALSLATVGNSTSAVVFALLSPQPKTTPLHLTPTHQLNLISFYLACTDHFGPGSAAGTIIVKPGGCSRCRLSDIPRSKEICLNVKVDYTNNPRKIEEGERETNEEK